MGGRLLALPFVVLVMLAGGCAPGVAPDRSVAGADLGPGFTNSELRSSIYGWSPEDDEIRSLCHSWFRDSETPLA